MIPVLIGLVETEGDGLHVAFDIGGTRTTLRPSTAISVLHLLGTLLEGMGVFDDDEDDDNSEAVH